MAGLKGGRIFPALCRDGSLILFFLLLFCVSVGFAAVEEKPQHGGILIFAVGGEPPTYDGHRESTFGLIHPISPHYSLLLKFDEDRYPKVVGDLAESWAVSKDQRTYTFKIRQGVKFHDGSILTSKDVKATYDKIIFPPQGVISPRFAFYSCVEKVEAQDDYTVVFHLKWASVSFLASLASPWNYIYKAEILAKNIRWYEKNIMGTGPFKFVEHVAGSHWVGKRNEDYFQKGLPYLDGYRALFIQDTGARVAAIRGGRVHTEFRGFPPTQRDDLVRAMGDQIRVQENSMSTCISIIFNCEKKPFNDPRVRRALTLALDRWEGSKALSKMSIGKWVGGLLRPGSEFALSEEELVQFAGYSRDIQASRREARRLLREAGVPEGFSFDLDNRPTAMPYEIDAIWVADQWRQIGLNVRQKVQDYGAMLNVYRAGSYVAGLYNISDYMDEPDLQFIWSLSADKSSSNFGRYKDPILDDLYQRQNRTMDPVERRNLCKKYQQRVLDEMAYSFPTFWWHRIVPHSAKLKGVKLLPSHFLNQDLSHLWLSKE
ncbi:MAG: ABC transporter substrate-binding protein [Thermodesulfobacteriota bacterium]